MSTLKTDAIQAATGTNTDLTLAGKGTGVPDIATGFKVGGTAGLPINNLRVGTDGELITWDASGDPAAVAVGTATHVLTSNGAGAAPTFQAASSGGIDNDCFFAWIGSVQTIANSTYTKIEFSTEEFDTANAFDNVTNYRYTPVAGKYLLTMGYNTGMNESADVFYFLYKNGTAAEGVTHKQICPGSGNMSSSMSMIVEADGTDYFEVFIRQNSGVSKDLSDDNFSNFFCGTRLL